MRFLSDEEYGSYWDELCGVREAIALDLLGETPAITLDVACGWGYFTMELAKGGTGRVVALDLVHTAFINMRRIFSKEIAATIEPIIADASNIPCRSDIFGLTTSFLGMRDIHMTLGEEGVRETVEEMIRATRRTGRVAVCVTPPDIAASPEVDVAIEVEGEIFGAKSLPSSFYIELYSSKRMKPLRSRTYQTGVKMTAEQTKIELQDGIQIAREIYGMDVPGFIEVWNRYGTRIEDYGYAMYSDITVLIGEKT
ncbi:MAG: class I SAM-dependent methyltransferase [Candidatus Bathyarchaeota archaeon]|jgi:ubiquinone/menaquinone biosynthesis C-methylase UbiE